MQAPGIFPDFCDGVLRRSWASICSQWYLMSEVPLWSPVTRFALISSNPYQATSGCDPDPRQGDLEDVLRPSPLNKALIHWHSLCQLRVESGCLHHCAFQRIKVWVLYLRRFSQNLTEVHLFIIPTQGSKSCSPSGGRGQGKMPLFLCFASIADPLALSIIPTPFLTNWWCLSHS